MAAVAEPGLLAVARPDGRDDLFRARWAGSDATLAALVGATAREALAAAPWTPAGRAVLRGAWLARLDYLRTAAVYVCAPAGVEVYLSLWVGLPTVGLGADPAAGLLVRVDSLADARTLRRRWRRLKGAVADAVAAGTVPLPAVPACLLWGLEGRARLGSPPWV